MDCPFEKDHWHPIETRYQPPRNNEGLRHAVEGQSCRIERASLVQSILDTIPGL